MPGPRGVFQRETFMQTSRGDCRLRVFPSMECPGSVREFKHRDICFLSLFYHRFGRGLLYQMTHTLRCFPKFLGRRCRRMASRGAFLHRGAVVVDGLGAAEARGAETWRKNP